jgi:hypothetical protein
VILRPADGDVERMADARGIGVEVDAEQRLAHQAQGEAHHLRMGIEARAVGVLAEPAIDGGVGAARKGLGEGQVARAVEGRLHQLAVPAPGLAFAGEEAGADDVPHAVVRGALHVVGGVLDEDVLHTLRVVDQDVGHRPEAVPRVVAPARPREEHLQGVAERLEVVAEERHPGVRGDGSRGRAFAGERGSGGHGPRLWVVRAALQGARAQP